MMSEALSKFHLPGLSCIALVLFLSVFIGAFLWTHRRGSEDFYKQLGHLPLDE